MKKILYIIPVFLLSIFFISSVYASGFADGDIFSCVDDIYEYLGNDVNYLKSTDSEYISNLLNCENFNSYLNNSEYPYFFILNYCAYFFSDIPTFYFYPKDTVDGKNIYCGVKFDSKNVKIAHFSSGSSVTTTSNGNFLYKDNLITGFIINSDGFYSKEQLFKEFYSNFDLKHYNSNEILSTSSSLIKSPEFSFIPTYSENYKTCNLKLDIKNEPEYYKLEYAINTSNSTWYEFDNTSGITVENNCLVIVRMLDENGDELFANSISVTLLENQLSTTYFKVHFDTSKKAYLGFTPILYNNSHELYDIKFSFDVSPVHIASGSKVGFSETNNATTFWKYYSNISDYICKPSNTYWLRSNGDSTVYLKFELYNKNTGILALTKEFEFSLSYDIPSAISSSTNGVKDKFFHTGGSNINNLDESINNPFSGINNSSSFEDIASVAEESFTTFSALFSILPGFIWALVAGAIGILIVLRVLGR